MGIKIIPREEYEKYDPDCAVLEITLRCNFRCIHCGGSAGASRSSELTLDEIRAIARDLKRVNFKRVSVIGGEPFIRKDWYDIARAIKDEGLDITFVTNGSLIPGNQQLLDAIAEVEPQVVGLSIDGGKAGTHDYIRGYKGSFEKVWQAMDLLQAKGIEVAVVTTVNRLNLPELPTLRDRLAGRDLSWQVQISSCNGTRFPPELLIGREEYKAVGVFIHECSTNYDLTQLAVGGADDIGYFSKKYPLCNINRECWQGCKAGICNLGIQSNGSIKGCESLPDTYIEGNIRERSLFDIWNDPSAFSYTRRFKKEMLKGFCATCEFGELCKGGCIDIATSISGHAFENPFCLHKQECEEG